MKKTRGTKKNNSRELPLQEVATPTINTPPVVIPPPTIAEEHDSAAHRALRFVNKYFDDWEEMRQYVSVAELAIIYQIAERATNNSSDQRTTRRYRTEVAEATPTSALLENETSHHQAARAALLERTGAIEADYTELPSQKALHLPDDSLESRLDALNKELSQHEPKANNSGVIS